MHLNYKKKRFCNSKFVVLLLTIILLSGCHSANPVTSSISETSITSLPVTISELTPAPKAEWSLNTFIDMELPDLDYASEDHLIFNGTLEQSKIELHHNIFSDLVATQDVLSSSLGN